MADFEELARKMFGYMGMPLRSTRPPGVAPTAYTRLTRTPIVIRDFDPDEDVPAQYWPSTNTIEAGRERVQPNLPWLGHEEGHAIYNRAGLGGVADKLEPHIPDFARATVIAKPKVYPNPTANTFANEGLGYSIGQPVGTDYVQYAGSKIKDENLRRMLLRLHENKLRSNP